MMIDTKNFISSLYFFGGGPFIKHC
jgi:hypothetical protein